MKRILAVLTCCLTLFCFGCNISREGNQKTATFVCGYDYGFHVQDECVLLLSGSMMFFNPKDYGIDYPLIAGDKIIVTYKGECLIQETYPSTVYTKDMEIIKIEVIKATVEEYEIVLDGGKKQIGKWFLEDSLGIIDLNNERPYVVNKDGSFCFFDELEVGLKVYAVTPTYEENLPIVAYYTYLPR